MEVISEDNRKVTSTHKAAKIRRRTRDEGEAELQSPLSTAESKLDFEAYEHLVLGTKDFQKACKMACKTPEYLAKLLPQLCERATKTSSPYRMKPGPSVCAMPW